ncbi:MAG: hypothetical protein WBQ18_16215 [Solirubrobacteraceae bacterium]
MTAVGPVVTVAEPPALTAVTSARIVSPGAARVGRRDQHADGGPGIGAGERQPGGGGTRD